MKMRSLPFFGLCFLLMVGLSGQVGAYDESDLKKVKTTREDCKGCDLSGADLSGLDLNRRDFSGADLSGTNLQKSDLTYLILKGANLSNADVRGAELYHAGYSMDSRTNLDGIIIDSSTGLTYDLFTYKTLRGGLGPLFPIVLSYWGEEGKTTRKLNLGFKDIRLGMTLGEIKELGVCDGDNTCYDKTTVYMEGSNYLIDDQSPIIWISVRIDDYTDETFQKYLGIFRKKYEETYSFTNNDMKLFNSNNDDAYLWVLFENGKVALRISRWTNTNTYKTYLSLSAQYRDETHAESLMKRVVPTKLESDDF